MVWNIHGISWLDEGWEIFKLGEAFFKLAQYIDSESAYLNVVIVDYPETGNSKSYKNPLDSPTTAKLKA